MCASVRPPICLGLLSVTIHTLEKNLTQLLLQGFEGIPDNIDAAFVWSGNGKIYFFKVYSLS
jgi:hypothetical protein